MRPAGNRAAAPNARPIARSLARFALSLGSAVIVAASLITLRDLTDHTVFTVTVPGFLLGLAFVVPHVIISHGADDTHAGEKQRHGD